MIAGGQLSDTEVQELNRLWHRLARLERKLLALDEGRRKTMSTGKNVLTAFGGVEGYITLALELGGTLVPLAKGLVSEIRAVAAGGKTTSYTVLVQLDSSELDAIDKLSRDDLAAINAELEKLGVPAVPVPPEAPPADASNS